jgi:hypothetical protein
MNTYPISKENKYHELQHIKTILQNNNYPPQTNLKRKEKYNTQHNTKTKMGHIHIHRKRNKIV